METKFVVLYEEDCESVFDTRADAEEYILSVAEEAIYEDFLADTMFPVNAFWKQEPIWREPEEWFDQWHLEDLEDVWIQEGGCHRVPRQTSYSAMLSHFAEYWSIDEAHYFKA